MLAAPVGTSERWNAWLQGAWFDTYQIVRPRTVVSQPVTVIEIDERSLARLGQWPWPRTLLADLIGAVLRYKPAAVGVDILMPEPDRLSPERLLARERARDPVLAQRLETLPSSDDVLARVITGEPIVLGFVEAAENAGHPQRGPPVRTIRAFGGSAGTGGSGKVVPTPGNACEHRHARSCGSGPRRALDRGARNRCAPRTARHERRRTDGAFACD